MIAKAKADALMKRLESSRSEAKGSDGQQQTVLVTTDQIVLFNNEIREKPESVDEALAFLHSYNNSAVSTVSAVVVTHLPSGVQESSVDVSTVYWSSIPEDTVERVVARGKIMSSAGGFRIEDPELNPLIQRLEGSVDSVMGMPLDLTESLVLKVLARVAEGRSGEESKISFSGSGSNSCSSAKMSAPDRGSK